MKMNNNTCVCCGAIIPEGRQVCPKCESGTYNPDDFFSAERKKEIVIEYGHDISQLHAFKDAEMTIEIPIESISKEALEKILGYIPIVRCRNCKHFSEKSLMCKKWSKFGTVRTIPSGFCHKGELI